jgi:hypothetical protein
VTALQFDSRKVISAAGENGVKVRNVVLVVLVVVLVGGTGSTV